MLIVDRATTIADSSSLRFLHIIHPIQLLIPRRQHVILQEERKPGQV